MKNERPVVIAWMHDPSRQQLKDYAPDSIFERLFEEIFDPDPLRSHVITLHLYVEYWIHKLLEKKAVGDKGTFHKNLEALRAAGSLEESLYENLLAINRLRNIYAHELDLEAANQKVRNLIGKLELDPYFVSSDKDKFRTICVQTMFLLEATFNNNGNPPKISSFPNEQIAERLKAGDRVSWQDCELLNQTVNGYISKWEIRCPICLEGRIIREKDNTPGFKESDMTSCGVCGLTGDGSYLSLSDD